MNNSSMNELDLDILYKTKIGQHFVTSFTRSMVLVSEPQKIPFLVLSDYLWFVSIQCLCLNLLSSDSKPSYR